MNVGVCLKEGDVLLAVRPSAFQEVFCFVDLVTQFLASKQHSVNVVTFRSVSCRLIN